MPVVIVTFVATVLALGAYSLRYSPVFSGIIVLLASSGWMLPLSLAVGTGLVLTALMALLLGAARSEGYPLRAIVVIAGLLLASFWVPIVVRMVA